MNNITKVRKLIEARKDFDNAFDKFYEKYLYETIDWENDEDYEKFCDYMAILAAAEYLAQCTDDILGIPRAEQKAISTKLRELINEVNNTTTEDNK